MNDRYLAAIAIGALAAGAVSAAYALRTADQCPQPSAASVTALFAPCQAFAASTGPEITPDQVMIEMSSPRVPGPASAPAQQPRQAPASPAAKDLQALGPEHATVGVAKH